MNHNVAVGHKALSATFTGNYNTAIGYQALNAVPPGKQNIAIGYDAMRDLVTCEECGMVYVPGYHPDDGCPIGLIEGIMEE